MIDLVILLAAQALGCASPQSQSEMTECAGMSAARADAAMNAQWTLTLAEMRNQDVQAASQPTHAPGPSYADALLAAQRAWLKFRDAECQVEGYAARGGSMQPMLVGQCLGRLTALRTKELAKLEKED